MRFRPNTISCETKTVSFYSREGSMRRRSDICNKNYKLNTKKRWHHERDNFDS